MASNKAIYWLQLFSSSCSLRLKLSWSRQLMLFNSSYWPDWSIKSRYYGSSVSLALMVLAIGVNGAFSKPEVAVNNSPILDYVHPDDHTQPTYSHPWLGNPRYKPIWKKWLQDLDQKWQVNKERRLDPSTAVACPQWGYICAPNFWLCSLLRCHWRLHRSWWTSMKLIQWKLLALGIVHF